jgi:hypothetical protein
MTLSMYQASVPVFLQGLANLSAILNKAAGQAVDRQLDLSTLLESRLAPDMFPLIGQVQLATDHAKGASARLAGIEVPKFDDIETSFDELQWRLNAVSMFVSDIDPRRVDGSEDREIVLMIRGQPKSFSGQGYLLDFPLPNFYFHIAAAYMILRHKGIEIGKLDFLGPVL